MVLLQFLWYFEARDKKLASDPGKGRSQDAALIRASPQPEGLAGVFCILGCTTVSCEWSKGFIGLFADMLEGVDGQWTIFYAATLAMILH